MNSVVMVNSFYKLFIQNLFATKGRANRGEYILRLLTMFFVGYFGEFIIEINHTNDSNNVWIVLFFLVILTLIFFLLVLCVIAMFLVTHRRLHDLNASGWWQLITFIPLGQILMIGFIFFKGTPGPNRYGPPPENNDNIVYPSTTYEKDNASIITVLCLVAIILFTIWQFIYVKNHALSEMALEDSTKKESKDSSLLAKKASELMDNKQNKEALEYINQALELEPKNSVFLIKKSEILYNLKDYNESIKYLNFILKEDPYNMQALGNLIAPLYRLGRYQESIGVCDKLISLKLPISNNHMFHALKARSLYKLEEYEEMLVSLDIALSMKPDYKPALALKSKALSALEGTKRTNRFGKEPKT